MFDNPRMQDPHYLAVWVWLLLQAKHSPRDAMLGGQRITVLYGQLTTGRKQIAECTGVNESKVDRILKTMESEQQIEQQITTTNRLISITNYEKYQDSEQQNEQRVNNDRTTSEQQVNTSKELKNLRTKELKKDTVIPLWKTDIEEYIREAREKVLSLMSNKEWVMERKLYHPKLDIRLSVQKAMNDFWLTEAGWKHKKKSKTEEIDWESTMNNALTMKGNQVYEKVPFNR
jgi:hypothetical protein